MSYSGSDTAPGSRNIAAKTIDVILTLTDFANLSSECAQVLGSTNRVTGLKPGDQKDISEEVMSYLGLKDV